MLQVTLTDIIGAPDGDVSRVVTAVGHHSDLIKTALDEGPLVVLTPDTVQQYPAGGGRVQTVIQHLHGGPARRDYVITSYYKGHST